MNPLARAIVVVLLLGTAAFVSPPPTLPTAGLLLALGAFWIDRECVVLGGYRYSPAAPLYLVMGMVPEIGPMAAAATLLIDAVIRVDSGFLVNLGQRLAIACSLLCTALLPPHLQDWPELIYLVAPLVYLAIRLGVEATLSAPTTAEEITIWRQFHLRIRPLEFGLAVCAPAFAAAITTHWWLALALPPLLRTTKLAAENALLGANEGSVKELLHELKGVKAREEKTARALDETRREKQLLEGFSQQLAGRPTLEVAAGTLVATTFELLSIDNAVVFLGDPPEPFSYRVSNHHREALQGAALTGLREPLVDRVWREGKPVLQKVGPHSKERLLSRDQVAAALPLGKAGVLYVGRQDSEPLSKSQLDRLRWLTEKATMALEVGFQVNETARQRRKQEQAVDNLERKVAWLSHLVHGAQEMSSSLQIEILHRKLIEVIEQVIPHQAGWLQLGTNEPLRWGKGMNPDPRFIETVHQAGRSVTLEDVLTSRFQNPGPGISSLLAAPLVAQEETVGALVLGSEKKSDFQGEQMDLFFLLCSQAAMALAHANLYQQVVEARRQLELSQASLVQSSKLTAIGQLAAGVAHELNSPLGAISLSVEEGINQIDERPELAKRLLAKAQEAVERSRQITGRLLAYSRKPAQHFQSVSLRDLVQDTLDFLAFQLRSAGVVPAFDSDGAGIVSGEPQPLQQVMTNLLLNAAQSMEEIPEEQRRLNIRLCKEDSHVRLDVADSGCGITEENLPRIFDPFFTTKPVGRGTGLGLWASQQIVSSHHGMLDVKSQVGQGTTFTIRLPLATP